jgi:hypothetical protein
LAALGALFEAREAGVPDADLSVQMDAVESALGEPLEQWSTLVRGTP